MTTLATQQISLNEKGLSLSSFQEPDQLIERIRTIGHQLRSDPDRSPNNPRVNEILTELVSLTVKPHHKDSALNALTVMRHDSTLETVRTLTQQAEGLMELHYSRKLRNLLSEKPGSLTELFQFPYFENYLELSLIEYQRITEVQGHRSGVITFIGGGPLPLTAISMAIFEVAKQQGQFDELSSLVQELSFSSKPLTQQIKKVLATLDPIDCDALPRRIESIDCSKIASASAFGLVRTLGLQHILKVKIEDGASFTPAQETLGIIVASLAEPKDKILAQLLSRIAPEQSCSILIRSVERDNLRELLYRPIDVTALVNLTTSLPHLEYREGFQPPAGSRLINSFEELKTLGLN